ncbi:sodium:proton antiporter NhaD [Alteromonas lipolytica]|uniref:Sodium:proton antiporter n=1 Tax=Alteromonas lipolytica TaxID=1856405 RepID=A0A1E8FAZ7_9ALTE|nr:sodium:proton antiporter NhaD [Alteromonas lipolytica]OFI33107.1 sodium:proton antiporter [Alteromonas lipolytica]GGF62418.1 sodium:proton antiporter [Alteromonas lipolytica]
MIDTILIILAALALLGVMFEEVLHINKAKITLFFGTLAWMILFISSESPLQTEAVNEGLLHNITEISTLWLFLVAAMTFVAYLNRKGLIANLLNLVMPTNISLKKLMLITALFSFCFSSLADNITATLVSIALVLSLSLPFNQTMRFSVLVVFAVNSGGVSLITGDVTTLMIFMQKKVTITQLFWLLVPSFVAVMVLTGLLSIGMTGNVKIRKTTHDTNSIDYVIAGIFLSTIIATLILNVLYAIPPMLTFLAGMAIMFLVANQLGEDDDQDPIMDYIRYIEFDTLLFFLGVLLLVGMLEHIEALHSLLFLYEMFPPLVANYIMGATSALIDNVPLTAALLKANIGMSVSEWMLLTYAVGVGGSLLVIGSAAGIVTMSKVKGLSFARYGKYFLLLLMAYSVGYALVYGVATYIMPAV